ncbi:MAG: CDP-glycerol glycerophosphotransferase family protein [Fidelibacterota bacterium]|nr:MAG: CDP-glycerol glycerophosphotransferase family protein [Candidatus Neomarinimicrobiota bacterium]
MSIRIGFLYLYHEYHVYHSAPIAFELSRLDPDLEVILLSATDHSTDLLAKLSSHYPGHGCRIQPLSQPWTFRYLNIELRRFPPPRAVVKRHAVLLQEMDVLVGTNHPVATTLQQAGITMPKLIMAFHGAGDRAYGFKQRLEQFDLLLLSGPKKYHRLEGSGILHKGNWAIVGYPKFDVVSVDANIAEQLFPEPKSIILYNPHFRRHLSSWYGWGREILDFFLHSSRYNLIFAPHVELKGRKQRWLSLRKYRSHPHIHVDLGSPASLDMTYPRIADIYLGDVSSQIGEFLLKPRPCVFLNSHHISWENNPDYLHWELGPVIDTPAQLADALEEAVERHDHYRARQIQYFKDSFDQTEESSSLRAARAIHSFLVENYPSR